MAPHEQRASDRFDPAPGQPARKAALEILSEVLRRKRPLDHAAAETLDAAALAPRDAGFARVIASATLRRFGQLEALIGTFVPKAPPPHKAGPTLEILLAGACRAAVPRCRAARRGRCRQPSGASRRESRPLQAADQRGACGAWRRKVRRSSLARTRPRSTRRIGCGDAGSRTYGEDTARAIAGRILPFRRSI